MSPQLSMFLGVAAVILASTPLALRFIRYLESLGKDEQHRRPPSSRREDNFPAGWDGNQLLHAPRGPDWVATASLPPFPAARMTEAEAFWCRWTRAGPPVTAEALYGVTADLASYALRVFARVEWSDGADCYPASAWAVVVVHVREARAAAAVGDVGCALSRLMRAEHIVEEVRLARR